VTGRGGGRRSVALIRGINLGPNKRVAMADLRAALERLGYTDVRTLLNSGNVVFTENGAAASARTAARIEQAMADRLGVAARVAVLSAADLGAIMKVNPLNAAGRDPARLFVTVLIDPADRAKLGPLTRQDWKPEQLALGDRAAYLWCPNGFSDSGLVAAIGRATRDGVTSRNWTTMTKLHALASAATA
jgi:uncharacterized protein (DUF1697 family)